MKEKPTNREGLLFSLHMFSLHLPTLEGEIREAVLHECDTQLDKLNSLQINEEFDLIVAGIKSVREAAN